MMLITVVGSLVTCASVITFFRQFSYDTLMERVDSADKLAEGYADYATLTQEQTNAVNEHEEVSQRYTRSVKCRLIRTTVYALFSQLQGRQVRPPYGRSQAQVSRRVAAGVPHT